MDSDDNENISDENLRSSLEDEVTGLRAKRLIATLICLFVLFIITLITLAVLSPKDGRTLFSARHPTVTIDKKIKKLAAERIITNKIRSAVDETLKINGENVVLRGNEQVRIDARNVNFEGMKRMVFNISRDGILHMRGRLRLGDGATSLPMSTSPSLSASLDGMRLCACAQFHHKLFIVAANKHCYTSNTFCS
uniref:Beta-sarcoglycan n=1 Tax=Caenorhabditis tropicalis TaxID=1561998 RepID=A0A1I7TG49_9PELO